MKNLNYKGKGEHSVNELELIISQQAEELYFLKSGEKQLLIHGVVKSFPSIIEIDFDGHLKCQIETTDKEPIVLRAVNGYGQAVDCKNVRINEV